MKRLNCWEARQCGREPGGYRVAARGVCPAALPSEWDGTNCGTHAGRFCWGVGGALCGCSPHENLSGRVRNCFACGFMARVEAEEDGDFALTLKEARRQREHCTETVTATGPAPMSDRPHAVVRDVEHAVNVG